MSELNLYQRLARVMASMGAVGKGGQVSYGERFAYHKIDDIDDKLRGALIEHGVVCMVTEVYDRKLEYFIEKDKYGKEKGAWQAECAITIELVNIDKPEDRTAIKGWGQGLDYSDKATGKAFSYALKSAYLSAFHLRGQPDNEQDNITAQPKGVAATFAEYDDLDSASQTWVDSISQSDEAKKLAPLGESLLKEPTQVQQSVWPYYCQKWAKFIKESASKEILDELGTILAKEPKHVGDSVRDAYKRQAASFKK